MENEQIKLIDLDLIDRPAKVSREVIDPEKIRELAESIREVGLLEPVILTPRNGRYEMVAGDRRYLAHKLLNEKKIKSIVKEINEEEVIVIRATENLQRVDLTPSEEGQIYLFLKNEMGLSHGAIAKRTGKSIGTIVRYIRFVQLPEEIRRPVDQKQISIHTLETLQEIEDPETFQYYYKMATVNGITNAVARTWVEDYKKTKTGEYYKEGGIDPELNVDNAIKPVYATCEICLNACEIKQAKSLLICPECRKKVRQK